MVKPWNHPPGKMYRPNKPDHLAEEGMKKRAEFGEKWDAIFGKKKLNNMEDSNVSEEQSQVQEGGEAPKIEEE